MKLPLKKNLLFLISGFFVPYVAVSQISPLLFDFRQDVSLSKSFEEFTKEQAPIILNEAVIQQVKNNQLRTVSIPLAPNLFLDFDIVNIETNILGTKIITGRKNPFTLSSLSLSIHNGTVSASIYDIHHGNFKLSNQDGTYFLENFNLSDSSLACPEALVPQLTSLPPQSSQQQTGTKDINGNTIIDVMIVYTTLAKNWAINNEGGIENVISESMNTANIAAQNSGLNLIFRLVHAHEVDYTESGNSYTDLCRITTSNSYEPCTSDAYSGFPGWPDFTGYMDEVHELRELYGADLVSFFTRTSDVGGLGWLMLSFEFDYSVLGFSLTRVQQATGSTHAHEMGHNMGSMHSRLQNDAPADESGGLFPYSTGWRWTGQNNLQYASVMTYRQGAREALVFSNPDVLWQGVPSGSYEGNGAPADNARSLRESKATVAAFMPKTVGDNIEVVYQPGWNMISTPYDLTFRSGLELLESYQSGTLFGFDENYTSSNNLEYGKGYWIYLNEDETAGFMGVKRDGFEITLNQGWSLIGAPRVPVTINQIVDENNILVPELIYTYEHGYISSDTLEPGKSYWVYAVEAGTISFDLDNEAASNLMSSADAAIHASTTEITIYSRDFKSSIYWLNHIDTEYEDIRFLAPPIPPAGVPDVRFDNNMRMISGEKATILLNPQPNSYDLELNQLQQPVSIRYSFLGTITEKVITTKNELLTIPPGVEQVDIVLLDYQPLDNPIHFALKQNYPNPFNSSTNIQFSLPIDSHVSLEIYTITGERVRTLLNHSLNAGIHVVPLSANDLSTGIYFYRLQAGDETQAKKMLLLK